MEGWREDKWRKEGGRMVGTEGGIWKERGGKREEGREGGGK